MKLPWLAKSLFGDHRQLGDQLIFFFRHSDGNEEGLPTGDSDAIGWGRIWVASLKSERSQAAEMKRKLPKHECEALFLGSTTQLQILNLMIILVLVK